MRDATVTVGPKSQVVIPKNVRIIADKIKPGRKVSVRALSKSSVIIEARPASWAKETYGMHKDIWKGVNAVSFINLLRQEWKQKLNQ